MPAEAFVEWAGSQSGEHYQLIDGEIVAMAPERLEHVHVTYQRAEAPEAAIAAARVPCGIFTDGAGDSTVFELDALVNSGPRLPGAA